MSGGVQCGSQDGHYITAVSALMRNLIDEDKLAYGSEMSVSGNVEGEYVGIIIDFSLFKCICLVGQNAGYATCNNLLWRLRCILCFTNNEDEIIAR